MNRKFKSVNSCVIAFLLVLFQLSGLNFKVNQLKVQAAGTVTSLAAAYQWNNTIPEKKPAQGAKNNGKIVLFDNSHQNTAGQADWVLDGGFSDFADALVKEGYTVREYRGIDKDNDGAIRFFDDRALRAEDEGTALDKNEAIITYDAIKDADVFVTAESNRPMRISERAALKKFIDSGKGVYFIADHYNADRNCNTWDSDEVYNGYNRYDSALYNIGGLYGDMRNPKDGTKGWLAENFGLRFRFNAIDLKSGATGIKPEAESDGLTKNVGPVLMAAGATLAISNPSIAKGIVYFGSNDKPVKWGSAVDKGLYFGGEAEGAFVAISKPSAGRAAFIGDSSPIEDATAKYKNEKDGSTKSLHAGWTSAGNAAQLSINIVNWLADSSINYVGFGSTTHPKGIATPTLMATEELTDPDKGAPWAVPTIDPWNTDTYAAGSYGAQFGTSGGGGTNPPPASGIPTLALSPIYIYGSEPFGIILGGDATDPELGIYIKNGGTQVGAVKQGNIWSAGNAYAKLTGSTPLIVTAKATKLAADGQMGIRARVAGNSSKADTRYVTSMATGYGYLQGKLTEETGNVAAVLDGEDVIGTAQIEADGNVKIAVKEGSGYTLSIYGQDGVKKSDLAGEYNIISGQSTPIIQKIDVTGISLSITSLALKVGETSNLTASLTPDNATNKKVVWSSDNEAVAKVDELGKITAVAAGEANIIAASEDGNKTASCKLTVTPAYKPETITVVATSDIHGNVLNYDYNAATAPSKPQGLAKVSTYMNGLRANNPYTMLVDNGDTIQGTPLVYYYNMIDQTTFYPMAAVMGAMKYDTWTLGNHEFNFGLNTLNRIMNDAKSQGINVLSANTYKEDGTNFVNPYFIKNFNINGKNLKVGILGLTTKTIPNWEDPAHYAGLHFNDLVDEANKWVPIVKANGADVVIVTAHSGEEGTADVIPENQIKAIAQNVRGIDAIVAGHVHNTVNDLTLKNPDGKVVPVVEPNRWGTYVSQIDIAVDENGTVTGLTTSNKQMDETIAEDPAIVSLIKPYQDTTLSYLQTKLGTSTGEFKGAGQLVQPTAMMELINKVQMEAAGTQLSIAAPLSNSAYIPQGDVTIQNIMSVYVYENFLYGVKMTGKQVKDWMEYSVRYYKQVGSTTDPIVKDPVLNIADYNLDQLYGANYDVDLTQPIGSRIKNLKYNGKLIQDTDVFTVAINNYRYNGGGGFMKYAGLSNTDPSIVTYDSAKSKGDDGQVRSLMMSYIQTHGTISPVCADNWKLSNTPVTQQVDVNGVQLNKNSLTVNINNSEALIATVLPTNATNKGVKWSSSNTSIATVDDNGVVKGIASGNVVITVTTVDGGYTAKADVTVKIEQQIAVKSVNLNKTSVTLNKNQSFNLVAAINPTNASIKDVVWTIGNSSIVGSIINGNGLTLTAKHWGTTQVTVKTVDGGYTATCLVIVLPSLSDLMNPDASRLLSQTVN